MSIKETKKRIVTHNGKFHTDEIFAVATIILAHPGVDFEVVRSRDPEMPSKGDFTVDVGLVCEPENNKFDHHQEGGAGKRKNGIPYASFGLVWLKFGKVLCKSEDIARRLDEKLIVNIDANDNGVSTFNTLFEKVSPYTIVDYFNSFAKRNAMVEENNHTFIELVEEAKSLLIREIQKEKIDESLRNEVERIYKESSGKEIIFLPKYLPWEEVLTSHPEPIFVAYPDMENENFRVSTVPKIRGSFTSRKRFPSEWAGKTGNELAKLTGVTDATFCHNGRFIAGAKTKNGVMKLAELALNK
jgi:uncharacterized UPF0160 family protein